MFNIFSHQEKKKPAMRQYYISTKVAVVKEKNCRHYQILTRMWNRSNSYFAGGEVCVCKILIIFENSLPVSYKLIYDVAITLLNINPCPKTTKAQTKC